MRIKLAHCFYAIFILLSLASISSSAALSKAKLERKAVLSIASDQQAMLSLTGLDGKTLHKINKHPTSLGLITNNSNQKMEVTLVIRPDFSNFRNENYWLGVKVGTQMLEFTHSSEESQAISLYLAPGESADIELGIHINQDNYLMVSFDIQARTRSGDFVVQLMDTDKTPRRLIVR